MMHTKKMNITATFVFEKIGTICLTGGDAHFSFHKLNNPV